MLAAVPPLRRLAAALLVVAPAVVAGCASASIPWGLMQKRYQAAIEDARVARPDEVVHDLVAITPDEPGLVWKGAGDDRHVLVVTWTEEGTFRGRQGETMELPEEVWVTVAPRVTEFCRRIDTGDEERQLRLEQLLGLPPGPGPRLFVELWVRPADLFRPCLDPEVTDHTCDWAPPAGGVPGLTPAHERWLERWLKKAYHRRGGYPWTRLGYTYDWGNPYTREGPSEFVVRPGATVEVETVASTERYCSRR